MDILVCDKGVFQFGPFVLDPVRRRLLHHGVTVKLQPKQFDTLDTSDFKAIERQLNCPP